MKPAPQFRGPPATLARGASFITTKPGRLAFSLPKPKVTQLPSEGRPASVEPVFIWHTPPTWFKPLDQHDWITASPSAHVAMFGSQSDTQMPLWPCCCHFRRDGKSGARPSPIGVITGLKLGGRGLPARRFSSGLGSKVSMWLGPPSMNRKITLRAVAGRRQGARAAPEGPLLRGPAARSRASKSSSASPPNPAPACSSHSRRFDGSSRCTPSATGASPGVPARIPWSEAGILASPSQRKGIHLN